MALILVNQILIKLGKPKTSKRPHCKLQDGLSGSLGNCSAPPTMENETVVALVNTECITPSNCWVLDINSVKIRIKRQ